MDMWLNLYYRACVAIAVAGIAAAPFALSVLAVLTVTGAIPFSD